MKRVEKFLRNVAQTEWRSVSFGVFDTLDGRKVIVRVPRTEKLIPSQSFQGVVHYSKSGLFGGWREAGGHIDPSVDPTLDAQDFLSRASEKFRRY